MDARRLRVEQNKIRSVSSLRRDGPGKIFLFDVPLCGHSTLVAQLSSSTSSDPLFLRMKAIDQRSGEEMGSASTRIIANQSTELSISLHEVYGRVAIIFELSGAEKMELTVERLRVQ